MSPHYLTLLYKHSSAMQESYYYSKMSKQFVSSKWVENDACWGSHRAGTNFTLLCFFLSISRKYFYKVIRLRVFFFFCLFPSPVLVNLFHYELIKELIWSCWYDHSYLSNIPDKRKVLTQAGYLTLYWFMLDSHAVCRCGWTLFL